MKERISIRNGVESGSKAAEVHFDTVYRKARFEFISDRNKNISRMSDVSRFHPEQTPEKSRDKKEIDIWFPVIDITLEPGMYGKAEIRGADICHMNSYFNFEETPIQDGQAIFPADILSDWENGLWIGSQGAVVEEFAVVKEFYGAPSVSRRAVCEFRPVCEDWGGMIRVSYQDEDGQWHFF